MLRVVIIDDERRSRETLRSLITEFCDGIEVVGEADSVESGVSLIEKEKPGLLFLDIEMGSGTGFDLLEKLQDFQFEVIFTTAYEQYALKAIKFSALDYLLKPIDINELTEAVQKLGQQDQSKQNRKIDVLLNNLSGSGKNDQKLSIPTSDGFEFIPIDKIVHLKADGAYTKFFIKGHKPVLVSKNLKEYENLLTSFKFCRVHHSHLINLKEVTRYVKNSGGYVEMSDGSTITISRSKKSHFLEKMNISAY